MKISFFRLNIFARTSQQRKRALDVVVSKRADLATVSLRQKRTMPKRMPIMRRRNMDGVRKEKFSFIVRLMECPLQDIGWRFFRKGELYFRLTRRTVSRFIPDIAPHKRLYGSLVGGVALGVVSMLFLGHYFGSGVFAVFSQKSQQTVTVVPSEVATVTAKENVETQPANYDSGTDVFFEYFNETTDAQYKETVQKMVKGYPIETMLPYIFEQDRLTAAFLIGIAKKESNWGKRVPVLDDQDCFNYWGYRGIRRMMGTGGHTCFNSSKDAVETVAKRLNTLITSEKLNTPEKMIVWKCGFSCSGHSRESVLKWISDVDMYFSQLSDE